MLTQRKPYLADSLITLLYRHANDALPRLPRQVATFQPIIGKTMAKKRADRFSSATELLNYIRQRWGNHRKSANTAPNAQPVPAATA